MSKITVRLDKALVNELTANGVIANKPNVEEAITDFLRSQLEKPARSGFSSGPSPGSSPGFSFGFSSMSKETSTSTAPGIMTAEKHRHPGVFIIRDRRQDKLATENLVPGTVTSGVDIDKACIDGSVREFCVWNPFKSRLAAAILGGIDTFAVKQGSKVLYLGIKTLTTVYHLSDIVGKEGKVFVVNASNSSADLSQMDNVRDNIRILYPRATSPELYESIVQQVDVIIHSLSTKEQFEALKANMHLLKPGGALISVINGEKYGVLFNHNAVEATYARVVSDLKAECNVRPREQLTLEPYKQNTAVLFSLKNK